MKKVFLITMLIISPYLSFAMVNGQDLKPADADKYQGVLALELIGTGQAMGMHIGDGVILTAWHVVQGSNNGGISVYDLKKNRIAHLGGAAYKVISIPSKKYFDTKSGKIPYLDLVILIPNDSERAKVRQLKKIEIASDFNTVTNNIFAIGWGEKSLIPSAASYDRTIQIGLIELMALSDEHLKSKYVDGAAWAALRRGDSGTPLLFEDASGIVKVFGITSLSEVKSPTEAFNFFTRLDNVDVQTWMAELNLIQLTDRRSVLADNEVKRNSKPTSHKQKSCDAIFL